MKKNVLITAIMMISAAAMFADKVISPEQLPQQAKELISSNFPGKTIQFVEADFNEYEIQLNDGTELQLSGSGDWQEIKSYTGVPANMLPSEITNYVAKNYPNILILKAEKDWKNIEIKLSNRMELYFDTNGKLLGQKYDD